MHFQFSSSLSPFRLFVTPWSVAGQASLSITNSQRLLKLMTMELVMPSNHPILCRPLILLPSIFSGIRVFSNESVFLIRWPKYWSFSISPSNEYSGLISFRVDWFDLWVGKIPWRRKWQPTPFFLPGKSHGRRSLQSTGPQRVGHDGAYKATQGLIRLPTPVSIPGLPL